MTDVLRLEDGRVGEIMAFELPGLLDPFNVPDTLSTESR